jgi:hypothetical protein
MICERIIDFTHLAHFSNNFHVQQIAGLRDCLAVPSFSFIPIIVIKPRCIWVYIFPAYCAAGIIIAVKTCLYKKLAGTSERIKLILVLQYLARRWFASIFVIIIIVCKFCSNRSIFMFAWPEAFELIGPRFFPRKPIDSRTLKINNSAIVGLLGWYE